VSEPEQALLEMRRVVKPGGLILLKPAWHCRWWRCEGIPVRPYADLTLRQKWVKLTLPIREALAVRAARQLLIRSWRVLYSAVCRDALPLAFERLKPDRNKYWMVDSDAACSLDPLDLILWFRSRGDAVLSHPTFVGVFLSRHEPLLIQVRDEG
jgi:hypothetical protein